MSNGVKTDQLIHRSDFMLVNYIKFGVLGIVLLMQVGLAWTMRNTAQSVHNTMQKDSMADNRRFDALESKLDRLDAYVIERQAAVQLEKLEKSKGQD